MNGWEWVRTAAVVAGWVTVAAGLLITMMWLAAGGGRAFGPEDQLMVQAGVPAEREKDRFTAFSSAQIGVHGFFGLATASLLTYAAARADDRVPGYVAVLVVAAFTAMLGLALFRTWRSTARPAIDGDPTGDHGPKVEDELPAFVVLFHGLAAAALVVLVIVLLLVG